ncbi:MAG: redoxin domain-containing protein, partial [Nitrososphaerota archaeon]
MEEEQMPKTDTLIKASDKAPDFKLRNYDGTEYTLSTLLKDTNLLLLFFRGTWCPNCRKQLLSLSSVNADFQRLGTQLVGVFCQKAEPVKQW